MFRNGARWLCADFHLHTVKDKEFKFDGESNAFVNTYVDKLVEQGVEIACITNHNKFDMGEYKALAKRGRKKGVLFYPGMELSIKEGANGIHCLIIFNEDEWIKDQTRNLLDDFLNEVFKNVPNRETANSKCNTDLITTIQSLKSFGRDFFIILAHVDDESGFLKECNGGVISSLTQQEDFHRYVLGFQKSRNRDLLNNYINEWGGRELALVEGSDCKSIDDIGKNDVKVFLKMGDRSFHTLKYALQDFKNRICREKPITTRGYIHSVTYQGGKLDGIRVAFSPNLNTLIGIRGSGKSSILETVRYVLGSEAYMDSEYKNDLVESVLGSGGLVSIEAYDRSGKKYEVRKILHERTSILDDKGNDLPISIKSIINNPLYFGQKDLSHTKPGYEFNLLERIVGDKLKTETNEVSRLNDKLKDRIHQLISLSKTKSEIEDLRAQNDDIEHVLSIFGEKGVDVKLKKQTSYNQDKSKLQNVIEKAEGIVKSLTEVFRLINVNELTLENHKTEYNAAIFSEAEGLLVDIISSLSNVKGCIEKINEFSKRLKTLGDKLLSKIETLKDEFAEIKREIKDDTLNPDSYLRYTENLERNKATINKLESKSLSRVELESEIKELVSKRNETLHSIFCRYKNEIEKINRSQKELKIEIVFKGNKEVFVQSMKEKFKGTGLREVRYSKLSEEFSDFVAILEDFFLNNGNRLKGVLTDNEYSKLSNRLEENYDTFVNLECPNLVNIYYHDKPLEKHSIGQRASALILFILSQQDNDIVIIDQPEDDLDNQVIYREVIQAIKEKKQSMQFIFATHNANIPVLGDAEIVISTKYEDERIKVDVGNVDCPSSQKSIVEIMEGGKEAFEKRKLIYNVWDNVI